MKKDKEMKNKNMIKIILFIIIAFIIFKLGGMYEIINWQKGARTWDWIIDKVSQSEQDEHYLIQCLEREKTYEKR